MQNALTSSMRKTHIFSTHEFGSNKTISTSFVLIKYDYGITPVVEVAKVLLLFQMNVRAEFILKKN